MLSFAIHGPPWGTCSLGRDTEVKTEGSSGLELPPYFTNVPVFKVQTKFPLQERSSLEMVQRAFLCREGGQAIHQHKWHHHFSVHKDKTSIEKNVKNTMKGTTGSVLQQKKKSLKCSHGKALSWADSSMPGDAKARQSHVAFRQGQALRYKQRIFPFSARLAFKKRRAHCSHSLPEAESLQERRVLVWAGFAVIIPYRNLPSKASGNCNCWRQVIS